MSYTVSHFEIRAHDQKVMEKFYTEIMGFIVSDRGLLTAGPAAGRRAFIFLSHSPDEHHQIVLIPSDVTDQGGGIGHVAFRVDSLDEVRRVYDKVRALPYTKPEPVSHAQYLVGLFPRPREQPGSRSSPVDAVAHHPALPVRRELRSGRRRAQGSHPHRRRDARRLHRDRRLAARVQPALRTGSGKVVRRPARP